MVILKNNTLEFSFPEVHPKARCSIQFERTLRIPDDNRKYPLPPGLGAFPLLHVEDFVDQLPPSWAGMGGVFLPMYQAEALWIDFRGSYPFAIKIAAGKVNAVTGGAWANDLVRKPQDYVVVPGQPWLDGFCVGNDLIRQFVAMPLGDGYTAEEQVTGKAEFGGLQIIAYPMKAKLAEEYLRASEIKFSSRNLGMICESDPPFMGLAPGGLMRQKIYKDKFKEDAWDTRVRSRCFVHLLNSVQFSTVTGCHPPTKPPTAADYTNAGLPWFEYYDQDLQALAGSKALSGLHSVAAMQVQKGETVVDDTEPVEPRIVIDIGPGERPVGQGTW